MHASTCITFSYYIDEALNTLRFSRSLHRSLNGWSNARVDGLGHDTAGLQLVGDDGCDGIGSSEFHLWGDLGGFGCECTSEDARESQHVVDLVRSAEHTSELQSRFDLVC